MESPLIGQASFGDVLKTYRKRTKITQRQLAEKLGVHYNTVWAWECGDHLPETKGMVLELAKQLRLNAQETRLLLEASLTAISSHWNVPYLRNPFFTGRSAILQQLHEALSHEHSAVLTQSYALSGLGGIGKTQTAIEYAYQYYQHYTAVFWISAETYETLASSFASIAGLLNLSEKDERDQGRIIAAVTSWLTCHRDWLLIVDNMEDLGLVKRFLPAARHGSILVTTRIQALETLARNIKMEQMSQEESVAFLLRRARLPGPDGTCDSIAPSTYQAARAVGEALDGLPLALDQAAAYVDETQCGWLDYLHLFQAQPLHLLGERDTHADHPASVVKTFTLAFEKIQQRNPAAADLLLICAFFAPDAVPEELLITSASLLGSAFQSIGTNLLHFNAALRDLLAYSLIHRNAETKTLTIHRLVQAVLKDQMDKDTQRVWAERAIQAVNQAFSSTEFSAWLQCERLLPHVLICATAVPDQAGDLELADMLLKAADYLYDRAQYQQTEALYQRALRIREQALGPDHPQVADALNGLARHVYSQGQYEQAEPLIQRALTIWEQTLGPEHPNVADALNGLANIYCEQGLYERAEALYRRALHIWEQTLGPEHPEVAYALGGLAELYGGLGKYELAEPFYQRALRIREQALGAEHPEVAYTLSRLADLSRELGRYKQSELFYMRALGIREKALGTDNPEVAPSLSGLADLYREQGKYELAEPLYWRALHIREQALGSEHPRLVPSLSGLADLYREQGKYELAEPLYQRALRIRVQALGPENPRLADMLNGLADLYREQGKYELAEPLYQQALALHQQHRGLECK